MKTPIPWPELSHLWSDERMFPIKVLKAHTPTKKDVFRAYKDCPFDRVKVVVLGQDPYPFPKVANGLAFDCSNSNYVQLQPSLDSIYDACERENVDFGTRSKSLSHLPSQGVLLLNSALTCIPNRPGSHQELWRFFIEKTIDVVNKKDFVVWLLYGNIAKSFKHLINKQHKVFESVHPVADTYAVDSPPRFYTWFNETNKELLKRTHDPIMWFEPSKLPF